MTKDYSTWYNPHHRRISCRLFVLCNNKFISRFSCLKLLQQAKGRACSVLQNTAFTSLKQWNLMHHVVYTSIRFSNLLSAILWWFWQRMIYRRMWTLLGFIRISQRIVIDSFPTDSAPDALQSKMGSHHCLLPFMSSWCNITN